jgi:hypothetical protein
MILVKPILYFYSIFIGINAGYALIMKLAGYPNSKPLIVTVAIVALSTWAAVRPAVLAHGRVFSLRESLLFCLSTIVLLSIARPLYVSYTRDIALTSTSLLAASFLVGAFSVVAMWLVIDTFANKIFQQEINQSIQR